MINQNLFKAVVLSAALIVTCLNSCKEETPVAPQPPANTVPANFYTDSIQPIFESQCLLGCHAQWGLGDMNTGSPDSGLILDAALSYERLVNFPSYSDPTRTLLRVTPGQPEQSQLYLKISSETQTYGDPMPNGIALITTDPEAVERIRRWIAAGAPRQ